MSQPIPQHIMDKHGETFGKKKITTLLIDGSNILELSSSADKRISSEGKIYGGIFQFLLQIKLMLRKGNFRYVYVFWDGDNSGEYRSWLLPEYKSNRDKQYSIPEGLSEYMILFNEKVKKMQDYIFNKKKEAPKKDKDLFYAQREIVMQCLEELYIRQCVCDKVEADDLIAYYVKNKKPEERIVIMSNDRDLTQLISDDIIVYIQSKKIFLTPKNHTQEIGYNYQNVLLKKMICGDSSDSIKGIKGVGETILLKNFPELKERKVELNEIIEGAKTLNESRIKNKKKPLKWAENIVNRVTEGSQGEDIYEINKKIIDLKNPLLTDEAKELMDNMMYAPLDDEGRSLTNLYQILLDNGIEELKEETKFANFFYEFKELIERERENNQVD